VPINKLSSNSIIPTISKSECYSNIVKTSRADYLSFISSFASIYIFKSANDIVSLNLPALFTLTMFSLKSSIAKLGT